MVQFCLYNKIVEKDVFQIQKRVKTFKKNLWHYLMVFLIFSLLSLVIQGPQIFSRGYILGVDSIFHMNRFYETMMQLKTGDFSYFISIFGFQQSARIINAVYGPGMAYVMGFILLVTNSWIKFQIVTSFLVNVFGAVGIYRIAFKLSKKSLASILCGCIYMTTSTLASWNISGSFTGIGSMMIPFVLYYGIEMLVNEDHYFSFIGLGLSMGLLLQTHLFSSLLATLALAPFVIYSFIQTLSKWAFFRRMISAVTIAILCSLNVWFSLFHLMGRNILIQTAPRDLMRAAIFFSTTESNSQSNIGVILTILVLSQIFITFFSWKSMNKHIIFMTVVGLVFLFVSSRFFPWEIIGNMFPLFESSIQFPSRIAVIAIILLLSSLSATVYELENKNLLVIFAIFSVIAVSIQQNKIYNSMDVWKSENVLVAPNKKPEEVSSNQLRELIKSPDVGKVLEVVQKGTSDYLPLKQKLANADFEKFSPYEKYWQYIITPNKQFTKKTVDGSLIVSWNSNQNEKINVPIVKYKDTIIKKDGKKLSPELTDIGTLKILSKKGMNQITVSYTTPKVISISIIISMVSILIVIGYIAFKKLLGK